MGQEKGLPQRLSKEDEQCFPNLFESGYRVASPRDSRYNCIATPPVTCFGNGIARKYLRKVITGRQTLARAMTQNLSRARSKPSATINAAMARWRSATKKLRYTLTTKGIGRTRQNRSRTGNGRANSASRRTFATARPIVLAGRFTARSFTFCAFPLLNSPEVNPCVTLQLATSMAASRH